MCKVKYQVPQNGATGFQRNLYLTQISELFPEVSEVHYCDVCNLQGAENTSTSMCVDCKDHLCQRCAECHCLSKFTHGHKVLSLEEIKASQHILEIRRLQKVYCPKHDDKVMEVYCQNCEKPMCYLCAMLEHKHHEIKNLEESAAAADDVIRQYLDTWKMASDHSTLLSGDRKTVVDNFEQQEDSLIEEIEQLYKTFKDSVIEEIDMKKTTSIEQLKAEIAKARKQAEVVYNEAELSRLTITGTLKYSQEILESAKDGEKLLQFRDIKKRLAQLDLGNLASEVIRPVFELEPAEALTRPIPDLTVRSVTKLDNRRIVSRASEDKRKPDVIS